MRIDTKKWVVLVTVFTLTMVAGDHFIRFNLILPGFAELELRQLAMNLARSKGAIEREVLHVQTLTTDWAQWDDMYTFAEDGNQKFIESNFAWDTLVTTGIHLIYILNVKGEIVYGKAIDPATVEPVRLEQFPDKVFPPGHPLLHSSNDKAINFSGILLTHYGPLLITSHKILTSDAKGPSHGTMFLGRFLEKETVIDLNRQTQVDFTVKDPLTSVFTEKERRLVADLQDKELISEPVDENFINAIGLLKDLRGRPGLLVTASNPRTIMEQGKKTAHVSSFVVLISLSLAISFIVILAFMSIHKSRRRQVEIEELVDQRTDQLRLSEKRLNALSDAAFEAIFLTEKGCFLEQNRAAEAMFGYSREEAIGQHANMWVAPEDREYVIRKVLEKEERPFEATGLKKDGSTFPVEIQIRGAEFLGRRIRVNAIRDLTEKKRAEQEKEAMEDKLRRSQKMESLGLMAGGVAHDLNNILCGIVNYPELILMSLPPDSPLGTPLKAIRESGKSAAAVVDDLLSLARGVSTSRENNNLNAIIGEYTASSEFNALKALHSHVTFRAVLAPDLLNISCSTIHIKKCVMNLVTNAAEAIRDKGEIQVSTRNQYCDGDLPGHPGMERGEYAVLTVADTGIGIPEGSLERIFEPFYSRKVVGRSGTGLGLAMAWSTVQDHHGVITVESGEGGTTFELYFPANRDEIDAVSENVDLDRYRGNGETVLVVDDDERQRMIALHILKNLGYRGESVPSGEEAVRYLAERRVDLVILDMVMDPGINGCETYRRIIETHPRQKAIITSGFSESADVQQALALGVHRFVKKPYFVGRIATVIHDVLQADSGRDGRSQS